MGNWFSKGYDSAQEQIASTASKFARDFFLKSGEEVKGVRILDDDSTNIRAHFVKGYGWFTCTQDEDCPLCMRAAQPHSTVGKAQNQFVFNVYDPREFTTKVGDTVNGQVKIWRVGINLLRMLNKKRSKYGPYPYLILEISKLGTGRNTTWNVEVERDENPFTLPEGQKLYDLEEILKPKTKEEIAAILDGGSYDDAPAFENLPFNNDDEDDEEVDWRKT